MKKLRDTNKKLDYKVRNISEELSNTFRIVFSRLVKIEEKTEQKEGQSKSIKFQILKALIQKAIAGILIIISFLTTEY